MPRSPVGDNLDEQQKQQQQLERRRMLNREAQKRFRDRKQQAKRRKKDEEQTEPFSGPDPHDHSPLTFSPFGLGSAVVALDAGPTSESPSPARPATAHPTTATSPALSHSPEPLVDLSYLTAGPFASPFGPAVGQAGLGGFHHLTTPLDTILSANEPLQWQDGMRRASVYEQSSASLADELFSTALSPPATVLSTGRSRHGSSTTATAPASYDGKGLDAEAGSLNAALFLAAEHGHAGVVRTLVQSGADVDAADENGDTALHLAVRRKHPDVVTVLLRHNAKRHAQNFDGLQPLQLAAKVGFDVGVRLLLRGS